MKTFYANIWIGGDHAVAVQACREYCQSVPLCVTVTPTAFVFVGGMEDGVCVRLIQYPRFPVAEETIKGKARELARFLRQRLCQRSFSIEFSDETEWDTFLLNESTPAP